MTEKYKYIAIFSSMNSAQEWMYLQWHQRAISNESHTSLRCFHSGQKKLFLGGLIKHYDDIIINILRPEQDGCHFQIQFLAWKLLYFYSNFTFFVRKGPTNQISIGPDNGLVPNRSQAIIWTDNIRHESKLVNEILKLMIMVQLLPYFCLKCENSA